MWYEEQFYGDNRIVHHNNVNSKNLNVKIRQTKICETIHSPNRSMRFAFYCFFFISSRIFRILFFSGSLLFAPHCCLLSMFSFDRRNLQSNDINFTLVLLLFFAFKSVANLVGYAPLITEKYQQKINRLRFRDKP